jgi:predicted transcriptional regulator of viral defense system
MSTIIQTVGDATMPGRAYNNLFEAAADQHGYLTTEQAAREGIDRRTLAKMAERGTFERISHGLYRLTRFPIYEWTHYMEAALWPQGVCGVLSHDTALDIHGLSDVNPSKVHITVPRAHRIRRAIPKRYMIYFADLDPADIPITTPERAIRDSAAAFLGDALIEQAIDDGVRKHYFNQAKAEQLRREVLLYNKYAS